MFDHIDAVVVFVQDLAGCTTFYRDTLRLPYLGSEATASAFRLRDRTLILLSPERAAKILVLRSSLMLSFPLEKPMGRTYLLWLQTLIQRFMLKVNSFCRCCELLVPLHLPQKMALKPSDSLHPLGDGNGSLLSPDNSPPPSYPESQNGGGRDRLPQASSSGF